MPLAPLQLRKNEDRRIRAGHLWVFSNEVDTGRTPLGSFGPGEMATLTDADGRSLGSVYVNPRSLIAARLVSRTPNQPLNREMLRQRIGAALRLRDALFARPFYRLVYSEGDFLPGLVVDRYGDVLVVQITTAGMERVIEDVVAVLAELLEPCAVLLQNDGPFRALEGLPAYREQRLGPVPAVVELIENGIRFRAPLLEGQKTGWFYDHRPNRALLRRYAPGKRVLDLFCYIGGWGVQAALAGATEVLSVDSSAAALEGLAANAELNCVGDRVTGQRGDARAVLRSLAGAGEHFDVVILDPPALIKRRRDLKAGQRAYHQLNRDALEVLAPGGTLVSASCSYHLSRDALLRAVLRAGRDAGRELQLLEQGHQGADHPVHPAVSETAYLKALFVRTAE